MMRDKGESSANHPSSSLLSLLHEAVFNGASLEPIRVLLAASPHLMQTNATNEQGETPLHLAVTLRDGLDIVKRLLELGADCRIADKEQQLPIHRAAQVYRNQNMVKLLVDEGGKQQCYCPDEKGKTSLHVATLASRLETVNFLIENMKNHINATDQEGNSALHLSCIRFAITPGYAECQIIKNLLNNGANPALINQACSKAIELAFPQGKVVPKEGEENISALQEIFSLLSSSQLAANARLVSSMPTPQRASSNTIAISSPSHFRKTNNEDVLSRHQLELQYTSYLDKLKNCLEDVLAKDRLLTDKYHHYLKPSSTSLPRIHTLYRRYQNLYELVFNQTFDYWLLTPEELLLQEDAKFLPRIIESLAPKIAAVRQDKNNFQQQRDLLEGNKVYRDVKSGEERKLTLDTAPIAQLNAIFGKQQVQRIKSLSVEGRQAKISELTNNIEELNQKEVQLAAAQAFYNEIGQRVSFVLILRRLLALSPNIEETNLAIKQLLKERALKTGRILLLEIQQLLPRYLQISNHESQAVTYCKGLDAYLQWSLNTDAELIALTERLESIGYFHQQYKYLQSYIRISLEEGRSAASTPLVPSSVPPNPSFSSSYATASIPPRRPTPAHLNQDTWQSEENSSQQEEPLGTSLAELQNMYGEDFTISTQHNRIEVTLPSPQDERYDVPLFQTFEPLQDVLQDFQNALQLDLRASSILTAYKYAIEQNKLILTFTCPEDTAVLAKHLAQQGFTFTQPAAVGFTASRQFFQPSPAQATSAAKTEEGHRLG